MTTARRLVLVVWEDCSEADATTWVHIEGATEPEEIVFEQVGFLLQHTAKEVVLTACLGRGLMGPRTRIPAGMVRSIVDLTPGAPVPRPRARK